MNDVSLHEYIFLIMVIHLFTNSTEQSVSSEANRLSVSQEIHCILWNPKGHYRIHNSPSPVPILSHINIAHALTSHFLKIHLNIILPSAPGSSKCSFSLRFAHKNPVYTSTLPRTCYMPHPPHYSRFNHLKNTGWEYRSWGSCLYSFFFPFPCYFVNLKSKYSSQHHILENPQLTFFPQSEQPSFTPTQNNCKSIVLYILKFNL